MGLIEYFQKAIYWNLIYENRYRLIVSGLGITLLMTLVSFFFGTLLGMLFCMAKGSKKRYLSVPCNLLTELLVKLPPLMLLMIFAYLIFAGTGLSTVVIAIITFTLKCSAHLAQMFRAAVDSVEKGEIEAARTLGYSKWQAFFNVVFPQAMHQVMPLYKTQFMLTMQDTSVVSLLAIQDLTRSVTVITSRTMDPIIALIITSVIYLLLGFVANKMLDAANREKHFKGTEMV